MSIQLVNANALQIPLADKSVHCVVTSPPYWGLRDYGISGQLGLEQSPAEYVANMVAVFSEVWRVLRDDGSLWLNIGDSYASNIKGSGGETSKQRTNAGSFFRTNKTFPHFDHGCKNKDLLGIPWRLAFALQDAGWYLRSDIIWHKPNPMPESVTDRPTKAHEYVFLLSKSERYFYDAEAIREETTDPEYRTVGKIRPTQDNRPGFEIRGGLHNQVGGRTSRNRRTVWTIATAPYSGSHFATYPPALVEPCIKAGTSERGVCPVCGAPWERKVEVVGGVIGSGWTDHKGDMTKGMSQVYRADGGETPYQRISKGFVPTCPHAADPVPATVLDPFAGSGTTLLVARKLGRHGIGLDLSMTYLTECARERLSLNALDVWENGVRADETSLSDLPMFAEL